ncbi:Major facilitator superfamily domain, general substrate transporter [Pseudocohnilembus persalinus]|uniref:Lysosomal dipeptide transporter MFSD1 n=1 Tax=Pseudocohnilembus persalinus TaxID=266149 RepID=A0A0V0R915_PSEPJ|nr:Major facilitator superfamily domain, general substrate transporter [Pseudocohnilembus persalinus]|eukprot:KRX10794.1 Major facilitator superfamily domain, general substrate transporter [Pseudocohnilembus persalinus]
MVSGDIQDWIFTDNPYLTAQTCSDRYVFGPLGGVRGTKVYRYYYPPPHYSISIQFEAFLMWDWETTDRIILKIDNNVFWFDNYNNDFYVNKHYCEGSGQTYNNLVGPGADECLSCSDNATLRQGRCDCDEGYIAIDHICVLESQNSCQFRWVTNPEIQACVEECLINNCLQCNNYYEYTCNKCLAGYKLGQNRCYNKCPFYTTESLLNCTDTLFQSLDSAYILAEDFVDINFSSASLQSSGWYYSKSDTWTYNSETFDISSYAANKCNGMQLAAGWGFLPYDNCNGGCKLSKIWTDLEPHFRIRIRVQLWAGDHWIGDKFYINVDGTQVYSKTYTYTSDGTRNFACGNEFYIKNFIFDIDAGWILHDSSMLTIDLEWDIALSTNRAWAGFRDFQVIVDKCQNPHCETCDTVGEKCTSCKGSVGLESSRIQDSNCNCPSKYYHSQKFDECQKVVCKGTVNEISSREPDNNCNCPSGYYEDDQYAECQLCISPCKECQNSSSQCTECLSSKNVNPAPDCSCLEGYYLGKQQTCQPCQEGCKTCSSATECDTYEQDDGSFLSKYWYILILGAVLLVMFLFCIYKAFLYRRSNEKVVADAIRKKEKEKTKRLENEEKQNRIYEKQTIRNLAETQRQLPLNDEFGVSWTFKKYDKNQKNKILNSNKPDFNELFSSRKLGNETQYESESIISDSILQENPGTANGKRKRQTAKFQIDQHQENVLITTPKTNNQQVLSQIQETKRSVTPRNLANEPNYYQNNQIQNQNLSQNQNQTIQQQFMHQFDQIKQNIKDPNTPIFNLQQQIQQSQQHAKNSNIDSQQNFLNNFNNFPDFQKNKTQEQLNQNQNQSQNFQIKNNDINKNAGQFQNNDNFSEGSFNPKQIQIQNNQNITPSNQTNNNSFLEYHYSNNKDQIKDDISQKYLEQQTVNQIKNLTFADQISAASSFVNKQGFNNNINNQNMQYKPTQQSQSQLQQLQNNKNVFLGDNYQRQQTLHEVSIMQNDEIESNQTNQQKKIEMQNINDASFKSQNNLNSNLNLQKFREEELKLNYEASYYGLQVPSPLQDQFMEDYNISQTQYNNLFVMFALPNIVLPLLTGPLSQKIGLQTAFLFYTLVMMGGAYLQYLSSLDSSYILLSIGTVLFGIGVNGSVVLINSFTCLWFIGSELSTALALINAIQYFGQVLASLILSPLYNVNKNMETPLFYSFLIILLCFISFIFMAILEKYAQKKDKESGIQLDNDEEEEEIIDLKDIKGFGKLFWFICICVFLAYACLCYNNNIESLLVTNYSLSGITAGQIIALQFIIQLPLTPLLGYYTDNFGKRSEIMIIGSAINVIQFIIFLTVPICPHLENQCHGWYYLLPIILGGIGNSFYGAVFTPMIALTVDKSHLEMGFGVLDGVQQLGNTISPIFMGYFLEDTKKDNGFFYFFTGNVPNSQNIKNKLKKLKQI